jgi:hypothetical protein
MPTITCKGQTFESPYSPAEAQTRFVEGVKGGTIRGTFAASLRDQMANRRPLSGNQLNWVYKLLRDSEMGTPAVPTTADYKSIVEHMTQCRKNRENGGKGLLYPTLMLKCGDQKLVLKLQGNKSKNAGGVVITSERGFGNGEYYGCLTPQGNLRAGRAINGSVLAILDRIAADPVSAISLLGKETGHCCYCFIPLTTVQSRIAGCGDTCAENWQVWYPNATETRDYLKDHPSVLEGASDAARWI